MPHILENSRNPNPEQQPYFPYVKRAIEIVDLGSDASPEAVSDACDELTTLVSEARQRLSTEDFQAFGECLTIAQVTLENGMDAGVLSKWRELFEGT